MRFLDLDPTHGIFAPAGGTIGTQALYAPQALQPPATRSRITLTIEFKIFLGKKHIGTYIPEKKTVRSLTCIPCWSVFFIVGEMCRIPQQKKYHFERSPLLWENVSPNWHLQKCLKSA